jgi:hypothetical protein
MTSYAAGLPFFRRGIEGDLVFTAAMFAAPVVLDYLAGAVGRSSDQAASV